MTITPEQAADALVARARQRLATIETRRLALRSKLPRLAALLRDDYGARRVFVFGSLAWGAFHADSDVDVAVDGIEPERVADAMTDADDCLGATVELFRLESLPESFRQRILTEGEAIP